MFDVIVVGARVAGAPTAMLLARQGHRVLVVDRAQFPSDVISTHLLHVPAVATLRRWGLLERVLASGPPPHEFFRMDFGAFAIAGPPPAVDGERYPYCVRRTVLDKVLVDAAAEAGAEVRERFTVEGLLVEDGAVVGIQGRDQSGTLVTERTRLVVGADGLRSTVARAVGAGYYHETPALTATYYAYYRGVSGRGTEIYNLGDRAVVVFPTNDDLACVFVACPTKDFGRFRTDVEGEYLAAIDRVPDLAARVRAGERVERMRATADLPNFFRTACGPGWALVGDAGYHKDPCLAAGIMDAFICAELLTESVHSGLTGDRPMAAALADYVTRRDGWFLPYLDLTTQLAAMEPPPPERVALLAAIAADPAESSRFFGVLQGSTPVGEYLSPDNVQRIMAAAAAR
ncbi:NAD(P)/FAD-dependent oxidoreductase [Phytohabitans rumicis]|uniref:FAD-dependent oxidoreductase n=1 Tax=Phytohabitans rumicis TaxID=1076125 RepID=A0A6V8LL63_9ACTN|nr:NAD(P)/FAD-dependent oxidoreductase [Phytohabitans rumicis]GFJ96310.1 FAD-dependent oxidoreductase [Phytohabitans rumicis]